MAVLVVPISYLNDAIGRKKTIMIMIIPFTIGWILIIFAKSVYTFYVSRLFIGVTECLFISLPMYIGEISSPNVRGMWGNALAVSVNLGFLLINIIGTYNSLLVTAYICLGLCLVLLGISPFLTDTPYFYIIKNEEGKARKTLQYLYQSEEVEDLYKLIKSDVERQMSEKGTWMDIFSIKSNRRALIFGLFLRSSVALSGAVSLTAHGMEIFTDNGPLSPQMSSIYLLSVVISTSLVAAFTINKFGRKQSFSYSCLLASISLFILTIYYWLEEFHPDLVVTLSWMPLFLLTIYAIFYVMGIGTIGILMMEELFSASIKSKALCLCTFANCIVSALVNEIFNVLNLTFGLYAMFLFFSISCAAMFVLSFWLVPETTGKTLEEIQQDLKK
ncbi:unnamed protein product [Brassicogethes aeneus]|uniref:Major facilitator superfamily (MFS) profile domain-containing protein n=1 Tax=Brassicogethes aeneus TaxID=1431903 RepID=A0A9P0AWJ5_BRAAE|nr:unnamed protein product [Brassicogethes aeneus]